MSAPLTDSDDLAQLARAIRRQREGLRLSLRDVAERAGVSVGFVSMLEKGRGHRPSYDRLQRVQAALGLGAEILPTSTAPTSADPVSLLGATMAAGRTLTLAALSRVLDTSVQAVRLHLQGLDERLHPLGLRVIDDGVKATLAPRADLAATVGAALQAGHRVSPLSPAQYEALAVTAQYGALTRRQLEEVRGVDCADLLAGLVEMGLLAGTIDRAAPGRPRIYRLTIEALAAFGAGSVEELRAKTGLG